METQKEKNVQEAMDDLFFAKTPKEVEACGYIADELTEIFGPVISVYTRAQAIEDGMLDDVSYMAKEAGFVFPVAITNTLYEKLADIKKTSHEDFNGRLWDVLQVLKMAIRKSKGGPWMSFTVKIGGRNVELLSNCGPGDKGEPVVTIGFQGDF
jgi:hypothetical protein